MSAPPIAAPPYDSLNFVLGSVRTRLNDRLAAVNPVSGKILENTSDFSQQTVNTAWRKMQDDLATRGYDRLIQEVVIRAIPVVASTDPASQQWISWGGFYDGVSQTSTPALPSDLVHPLLVWERRSNQNAEFGQPMEKILDGLPACLKTTSIRFWEWRNDAIYFPGSQIPEDLRIRYSTYLADFSDAATPTPQRWFNQPVPIMRCSNSLSWYICAEMASSRGERDVAGDFLSRGQAALDDIFNLDVRADQRVNIRRRPRSGRGQSTSYF